MAMVKSINELPAEILGMVFFEFVELGVELEKTRQGQTPERLTAVCRSWKELVESNPELWSRIDVQFGFRNSPMDVEPIKAKIQKAKQSPLALYIHGRLIIVDNHLKITRDVLALYDLVKNHRWRALSIFDPKYLSPFEIIFRHIIDNPHMCRLSSFRIGITKAEPNAEVVGVLLKEALRQNLNIKHLAIPVSLLEPSHPLLQAVSYLQFAWVYIPTDLLSTLSEASSLRSLRVGGISRSSPDPLNPPAPCTLPMLEQLDFHECPEFPELIMQKLDLPSIQSLKFKVVRCSIKRGDEQLKMLVTNVPWLTRIKSLNLDSVYVSEDMLLWTLRRLPLLRNLTLASWERVSGKTTKKLSERPTARREWLCPILEEIEFRQCLRLLESDVIGLVEARVRVTSGSAPASTISPSLLRKVIWRGRDMALD
ncbi:hypothetical protein FRB94_013208 [Tulasnella sp. JGI-2019a]|nr:hypothetical protein FRB93_011799 [Tulasnella sp. JGI-2019a]KAG9008484.1 hypothetical protein FRB94_013208 [Tulasnella sp. JGI-2019a]